MIVRVLAVLALFLPFASSLKCYNWINVQKGQLDADEATSTYAMQYDMGYVTCAPNLDRCISAYEVNPKTFVQLINDLNPSLYHLLESTTGSAIGALCGDSKWCNTVPGVANQVSCRDFNTKDGSCCCTSDGCTGEPTNGNSIAANAGMLAAAIASILYYLA